MQWKNTFATNEAIALEDENTLSIILNSKDEIPAFTKDLVEKGASIFEIKIKEGLEEWFMKLTEN